MGQGKVIQPADLGLEAAPEPTPSLTLRETRSRHEREVLVNTLIRTKGNISEAARDVGISRPTFHALLKKHRLNSRAFK